ncbi:hypothetical protein [Vibrio tasmaniensis]|uniref:hypothetical protein n=1 Tax=Vibrio tasmaniensis TaxID=212663 RepID=UPI00107F5089|nr:hypothetical protein [Vibrio tasmaniensis]
MKKLVFLACFFSVLHVHAQPKYSDEVVAKAEAMLGKSSFEVTDPNELTILEVLNGIQNLEQTATDKSVECRFTVSIDLDGSVKTKTSFKQVDKGCEEAYLNLKSIKSIELPEPKVYDGVVFIILVPVLL